MPVSCTRSMAGFLTGAGLDRRHAGPAWCFAGSDGLALWTSHDSSTPAGGPRRGHFRRGKLDTMNESGEVESSGQQ